MARVDLASALTLVDCPNCGTPIIVPYLQIRIQKAVACRESGILIVMDDDTPPAVMRALIVRAGLMNAANDG